MDDLLPPVKFGRRYHLYYAVALSTAIAITVALESWCFFHLFLFFLIFRKLTPPLLRMQTVII